MSAPALDIRGLSVAYGGRPALWDVDATFPAGALSAIVGPNGAGKSTLLKAALGLVPVEAGLITIAGVPAGGAHERVAYVPQRDAVDWDFPITVREVVEMGRYPSAGWLRRLRAADHAAVDAALERVGMAPFASRQIDELSGGQRQRVFLGRALAQEAGVLLLDEPFTGIDARTEVALLELLCALRDEGRAIVLVHHDLGTVRAWFDWALLLNVRTVACGPVADALDPAALRRAYGTAAAAPAPGDEPAWAR
ncbi:MAG: metal ABC transporter ATP-binding protein [Solirubrobacteraceae bacterium]|jgi:manganese/zinc/iron transport system ATP- binding protein|nr:metal ABC transporter ATP-binding protein [Solirubrobacteraceae bacterium]